MDVSKSVDIKTKDLGIEYQNITTDLYSKELIFKGAFNFFSHPPRIIDRNNFKIAKKILLEIEKWEIGNSKKKFSILKNDSVLVAYLAYKFGELVGLNKKELSDVYISGLIQNIGKMYMCGEDTDLAYTYIISPLKSGEKGFKQIAKALEQIPAQTQKYLEGKTKFRANIIDTATNFRSIYSNLFKQGYPNTDKNISQLDTVLWFADSLCAMSFSSIDALERNYKKGTYVSLMEAFELLREQTEDKIPQFWSKTSGATLMSLVFSMIMAMSSPLKAHAAEYTTQQVISATNRDRESRGLKRLSVDTKLMQAAINKAKNMFAEQYWSHYGPNGESPWQFIRAQGYSYVYAGENLAKGFNDIGELNQAWLNSPEHRKNMLNPRYDETGVAVMDGVLAGKKVTLVVQMFTEETPVKKTVVAKKVVKKVVAVKPAAKETEKIPVLEEIKPEKKVIVQRKIESVMKELKQEKEADELGMLTNFNDFLERTKLSLRKKGI